MWKLRGVKVDIKMKTVSQKTMKSTKQMQDIGQQSKLGGNCKIISKKSKFRIVDSFYVEWL